MSVQKYCNTYTLCSWILYVRTNSKYLSDVSKEFKYNALTVLTFWDFYSSARVRHSDAQSGDVKCVGILFRFRTEVYIFFLLFKSCSMNKCLTGIEILCNLS